MFTSVILNLHFYFTVEADLVCAEAISRQQLHTFQAPIKSRTPYPAEPVKHKKELVLQGMWSSTATSTGALRGIDTDATKTRS